MREGIRRLEEDIVAVRGRARIAAKSVDPKQMTTIVLVSGYNGFGLHIWLSIMRHFPHTYRNSIFVSVAEIDSGAFKGIAEIEALKASVREGLEKYVNLSRSSGIPADYRMDVGTDVVETATHLCEALVDEFPLATIFTGKVVFRHENLFQKMLHNETAFAIQRRLQWKGITTVILPIRIDV